MEHGALEIPNYLLGLCVKSYYYFRGNTLCCNHGGISAVLCTNRGILSNILYLVPEHICIDISPCVYSSMCRIFQLYRGIVLGTARGIVQWYGIMYPPISCIIKLYLVSKPTANCNKCWWVISCLYEIIDLLWIEILLAMIWSVNRIRNSCNFNFNLWLTVD